MKFAAITLLLAFSASDCSSPSVPMPERSNRADFAILNRTSIHSFAEVYVMVHIPTGKCYVIADPGKGGGAITTTEQVVCMNYMRVEEKK